MANDSLEPGLAPAKERLLSLDAFRGITMLAMVVVNNPGSWGDGMRYAPLDHATWLGWTPTDLIFPSFLFIVGTALAYSLRKYREGATISRAVYGRIFRRTVILILLGISLDLFTHACALWFGHEPSMRWDTLRYPGVLQRIALVYCAVSLLALHTSFRAQAIFAVVTLAAYAAALTWLPNPGDKAANISDTGNVVRLVDSWLLDPAHWYTQGKTEKTEPEGLLSTFPSIVNGLIGYWCGLLIQRRGVSYRTAGLLVVLGTVLFGLALAWNPWVPIGKKLWTSSFTLLTVGFSAIGLGICLAVFDVAGWRKLARPFEVVGVNSITVYLVSDYIAILLDMMPVKTADGQIPAKEWIYENVFAAAIEPVKVATLAFALTLMALLWAMAWGMERLGWRVRV